MLKQLLFISFLFVVSFGVTQDWDFSITDANMTIQVSSDVVSFDGNIPPEGSLLGAFYINDLGEYTCAGFQVWTGEQLAVALWGTESGLDNGFAFGETINWFIQVNNIRYIYFIHHIK